MTLTKRTQRSLFAYGIHALIVLFGAIGPLAPSADKLSLTHTFADVFMQWDSQWFVNIAKYGYLIPQYAQQAFITTGNDVPFNPPYRAAAFFPGLPVVIHLLSPIGALILVEVLFFFALWLMYGLIEAERPTLKTIGILLFAINPCAIYFSALYTETFSLFGILLILYGLRHPHQWSRYALSLAGVIIATSMHDLGVFTIVFGVRLVRLRLWWRAVLYAIAAGIAPAIYELYLWRVVHNPLAIFTAEDTWERGWKAPFVNVIESLVHYPITLDTLVVIGLMVLVIVQIVRCLHEDNRWRVTSEKSVVFSLETGIWMLCILLLASCAYITGDPLKSVMRFLCILWPAFVPLFLAEGPETKRLSWMVVLTIGFGCDAAFGAALFTHGWFFQ
ncbi:hypothetical protein [Alicyclobacillus suci]|uniref:hypothetical protein n=1 Tax=Alicyclobacillus suci TaxID=2816080 RepID=UPI001A8F7D57|nr:hypothetical protein [Alicyclobacillus suci]